ncbi:MAG TPA: autoinducer-2 kinase [Bacillales bacterium]|nr:autoinducer-2 kinase [Bacillales bacterium]
MDYILAFDAGTGSIRAVLFDTDGNQVVTSQYEWTHIADPAYPESMDFDTDKNWELVKKCSREVVQKTKINPVQIKVISATSMREGFVLYDRNGDEIWACANVDARSSEEVKLLKSMDNTLERKIYELSGQTFALGAIPRLLWLKIHKPELYEKASSISMINDWILYKLTGQLQVDPSNGCTTGIFNLQKRDWSTAGTDLCGIKNNLYPQVHEAGVIFGKVTHEAAALTGLAEGTPVASGAGDAQAASVGTGTIQPGQTLVSGGSFWQQEINITEPIIDPNSRVRVNCHALSHLWQLETIVFFPGLVMRWFRDSFCELEIQEAQRTGKDPYDILEEKAKEVPVGSHGIMPIFSNVMNYISWRHASPSFINLSLDANKCGKNALFRAIQENAAIVTLGNLKIIAEETGHFPEEVIFAGGASKGKLWSQILADVLGIPVKVPVEKEAAALGTAIMAGVGSGIYNSVSEAAKKVVHWEREHKPDPENNKKYNIIYSNWQQIYSEQLKLADEGKTSHMWKAPGLEV